MIKSDIREGRAIWVPEMNIIFLLHNKIEDLINWECWELTAVRELGALIREVASAKA